MKSSPSLEVLVGRPAIRYDCQTARVKLSEQLKFEAYDDMPLDNAWVASVEKENPGIITALIPNHNYTTASPDENRHVIMEAMNSGVALKAGLITAVILLIYKVYRVLTNNKSFDLGGGGGRGTAAYNQSRNEEIRTQGQQALNTMDRVASAATAANTNPLHREEDSSIQTQAHNVLAVVDQQAARENNGNALEQLKKPNYECIFDVLKNLPIFIVLKSNEDFEGLIHFYTGLLMIATGDKKITFDFNRVNNQIALALNELDGTPHDQWLGKINAKGGIKEYCSQYYEHVKHIMSGLYPAQDLAEVNNLRDIQNTLKGRVEDVRDITQQLRGVDDFSGLMSKEEMIEDIKKGVFQSGSNVIFDRCVKMGEWNQAFQTLVKDYDREFDDQGNSTFKTRAYELITRMIGEVRNDPQLDSESAKAIIFYLTELQAAYEIIQIQVLGSIFKFRMTCDKINVFQDQCLTMFENMSKRGEVFIDTVDKENSEVN